MNVQRFTIEDIDRLDTLTLMKLVLDQSALSSKLFVALNKTVDSRQSDVVATVKTVQQIIASFTTENQERLASFMFGRVNHLRLLCLKSSIDQIALDSEAILKTLKQSEKFHAFLTHTLNNDNEATEMLLETFAIESAELITMLEYSISKKLSGNIDILLKNLDPNQCCNDSRTVFEYIVMKLRDPDIVKQLLERGANITRDFLRTLIRENYPVPDVRYHIWNHLIKNTDAKETLISEIVFLSSLYIDESNPNDKNSNSLMVLPDIYPNFLQREITDFRNGQTLTVTHYYAKQFFYLPDKLDDYPELLIAKTRCEDPALDRNTLLHGMAQHPTLNFSDIVDDEDQELIEPGDWNEPNSAGLTPLHFLMNNSSLIESLMVSDFEVLEQIPSLYTSLDREGNTPMVYFMRQCHQHNQDVLRKVLHSSHNAQDAAVAQLHKTLKPILGELDHSMSTVEVMKSIQARLRAMEENIAKLITLTQKHSQSLEDCVNRDPWVLSSSSDHRHIGIDTILEARDTLKTSLSEATARELEGKINALQPILDRLDTALHGATELINAISKAPTAALLLDLFYAYGPELQQHFVAKRETSKYPSWVELQRLVSMTAEWVKITQGNYAPIQGLSRDLIRLIIRPLTLRDQVNFGMSCQDLRTKLIHEMILRESLCDELAKYYPDCEEKIFLQTSHSPLAAHHRLRLFIMHIKAQLPEEYRRIWTHIVLNQRRCRVPRQFSPSLTIHEQLPLIALALPGRDTYLRHLLNHHRRYFHQPNDPRPFIRSNNVHAVETILSYNPPLPDSTLMCHLKDLLNFVIKHNHVALVPKLLPYIQNNTSGEGILNSKLSQCNNPDILLPILSALDDNNLKYFLNHPRIPDELRIEFMYRSSQSIASSLYDDLSHMLWRQRSSKGYHQVLDFFRTRGTMHFLDRSYARRKGLDQFEDLEGEEDKREMFKRLADFLESDSIKSNQQDGRFHNFLKFSPSWKPRILEAMNLCLFDDNPYVAHLGSSRILHHTLINDSPHPTIERVIRPTDEQIDNPEYREFYRRYLVAALRRWDAFVEAKKLEAERGHAI